MSVKKGWGALSSAELDTQNNSKKHKKVRQKATRLQEKHMWLHYKENC